MGLKVVRWCDIVDEVRYWDAIDLLKNLDDELENAGRGFASCIFHPGQDYPYAGAGRGKTLLKPEISKKNDHVEIRFPNLKNVQREENLQSSSGPYKKEFSSLLQEYLPAVIVFPA